MEEDSGAGSVGGCCVKRERKIEVALILHLIGFAQVLVLNRGFRPGLLRLVEISYSPLPRLHVRPCNLDVWPYVGPSARPRAGHKARIAARKRAEMPAAISKAR